MTLKAALKTKAEQLGFQLVGVTTPDPPPHIEVYRQWVAAGNHAEMGYLATERALQRRADPRRILPECRSILVLGIRYPRPIPTQPDAQGSLGRVAAYAWGYDYHDVLTGRMDALVTFIEEQVGHPVPNRYYTDTGPILERELAQRAGLGWIGKNTCLIHPRLGSYFLLAEIFLGIDLEPDQPVLSDHCGSCTRCLEACPTGCINPDRTLDAGRCISYLTIELKEVIPLDLRPLVGDWVFGCDICQQVCPWNQRFAELEFDPAFAPREGFPHPTLNETLDLDPQEFNRKYKGSPVKRSKRRGFLRNVAVALGNSGDQTAVPALGKALQDPEPLVRGHAAWALGNIRNEATLSLLQEALAREQDDEVLSEIRRSLSRPEINSH
jgi:epoxyqueuosine reductase